MKKLFIAMSIVAFGFASCGDASGDESGEKKLSEICECAELQLNIMKDMKGGMDMKDREAKYASKWKKCEEMAKGKSDLEKRKMKKEMEACPAYKEVEKMQKEMMGDYGEGEGGDDYDEGAEEADDYDEGAEEADDWK